MFDDHIQAACTLGLIILLPTLISVWNSPKQEVKTQINLSQACSGPLILRTLDIHPKTRNHTDLEFGIILTKQKSEEG